MTAINREAIVLDLPDIKAFPSHLEALTEGFRRGIAPVKSAQEITEIANDPHAYLKNLNAPATGTFKTPNGMVFPKVAYETLWLMAGTVFIGEVSFRHELHELLLDHGGHVGYGIRPSLTGQGYGTLALKLVRERAKRLGMKRLLVTCAPDNPASEKIILNNDGVLEDVRDNSKYGYGMIKRYWVPTA